MSLTKVTYSMIDGAVANVRDFGATGNGVTDDTVAVQAALDSKMGAVFFPAGAYLVTSLTVPTGVSLIGENSITTAIKTSSATSTVLTCGISAEVRNLKFSSAVTRTTGFYIRINGNGCLIENCEFENYYIGISVGEYNTFRPVNTRIFNCQFRSTLAVSGAGAVQFLNFSNAQILNCVVIGTTISSLQPSFGIRFQNGDTAFVSDCNVTLHGRALLVDTPSSLNCYALSVSNSIFDSAHEVFGGVAVSSAVFSPAGNVLNTRISNCWFGLSTTKSGCELAPTGSGTVDGITFTGCEFTENGESGLIVSSANCKNWTVTGGFSGGNAAAGIRAANGTGKFVIVGHIAGSVAGRGPNDKGIVVDIGTSDNYLIADNNVVGNTTFDLVDGGTGVTARVVNNVGYNGEGIPTSISVGASPFSYSAGHSPETIYISGGTGVGVSVDAQVIFNTSEVTVQLQPNDLLAVFYTTPPTLMRRIN